MEEKEFEEKVNTILTNIEEHLEKSERDHQEQLALMDKISDTLRDYNDLQK